MIRAAASRRAAAARAVPARRASGEGRPRRWHVPAAECREALRRTATLRGGVEMPLLGLGTWRAPGEEVEAAVYDALRLGYRHVDCAPVYGNQEAVGRALRRAMDDGLVTRDELFVTTKLWNTDHRPEHVRGAAEQALAELGLAHADLYLVHWPVAFAHTPQGPGASRVFYPAAEGDEDQPRGEGGVPERCGLDGVPMLETWGAMLELRRAGLARAVGVSNHSVEEVAHLATAGAPDDAPAVNQFECHPWLPQARLRHAMQQRGVQSVAYSPLGSRSHHSPPTPHELLEHPATVGVARELAASPAQVLLAWNLQQGNATIPKTRDPKRLIENAAAATLTLLPRHLRRLKGLSEKRPVRMLNPRIFRERPRLPFFPPDTVEAQTGRTPARLASQLEHSFHWVVEAEMPPIGDKARTETLTELRGDLLAVFGRVQSLFVSPKPNRQGRIHGHVAFESSRGMRVALKRLETQRLTALGAPLHGRETRYLNVPRNAVVILRGLAPGTTQADVRDACSAYGLVRGVEMHPDRTSEGSAIAHVRYRDPLSIKRVRDDAAKNGITCNGAALSVAVETSKEARPEKAAEGVAA